MAAAASSRSISAATVGLLCISMMPAGRLGSAQAPSPGGLALTPLVVGVVRGDGVMLPIASMHDGRWSEARAYDASSETYRFHDQLAIPPSGWSLHVRGEPSRPLPLLERVTVDAFCERQEGFATGARPPAGTVDALHLTWAVATSRPVDVAPVADVRASSDAEDRRVVSFIRSLTNAVEVERLAARPSSQVARLPAAERARVVPEITALVRDRVPGLRTFYYFEARKPYARAETYSSGWIQSSSSQLSLVNVDGGVYEGGETARRLGRVLGVLRAGSGSLWIMEMRYYEGTGFVIVDPAFAPQFLQGSGGGC